MTDFLVVPEEVKTDLWCKKAMGFYYVKLHGSYAWKAENGGVPMVLGESKREAIRGTKLFSWYFETFERAISADNRKLLAIGYGFGDPHINNAIAKAIAESRLELSVMTRDAAAFLDMLGKRTDGQAILQGLKNIFDTPLKSMYPADQSFTEPNREFQERYFGQVIQ